MNLVIPFGSQQNAAMNRLFYSVVRAHMKLRFLLFLALLPIFIGCTSTTRPGVVGVTREQFLLISAADVERMATIQYAEQYNKAKSAGKLVTDGEELDRLKRIGERLIKQSKAFRDDTNRWKWHLTLIDLPILNASCAPGGKITFYTGIIRQLDLTDDEIAAIMGHEIAHALREHGREKVSLAYTQELIGDIAAARSQSKEKQIFLANQVAHYLFVLPNSRTNETEADRVDLELMARAGYDPRAAISLWQKMLRTDGGKAPPQFLSTHPSQSSRIADISRLLPVVQPLYASAIMVTGLKVAGSSSDLAKSHDWCPEIDNFCDSKSNNSQVSESKPQQRVKRDWCPEIDSFCP
jgi:predicted Zn-dependent protease